MVRPARALQEGGDGTRRSELTDELDVTDIDAQLQRCSRDQRGKLAVLQALFRGQPALLCEAAVMRRDLIAAKQLRQVSRGAFRHASRVHEDQRRPMLARKLGETSIELLP